MAASCSGQFSVTQTCHQIRCKVVCKCFCQDRRANLTTRLSGCEREKQIAAADKKEYSGQDVKFDKYALWSNNCILR